jgi:hypothetical protein
MVRVARFVASVGVKVLLVTDKDAPRSVARVVEENRGRTAEVRVWLAEAAEACPSPRHRGWRPFHGAGRAGKATVTSPESAGRCPPLHAPERLDSQASQLQPGIRPLTT